MTWVLWNLVSDRLEIVLVSVEDRCMVCAKRCIGSEIIFNAPMFLLGDEAQVEAPSSHLEIVLILTQDRCAVCTEHTISSKILLVAPDGTPR